jgi:hypothetical protein
LKYTWVSAPPTNLLTEKTFWCMCRQPGKGAGSASNYSAANKKIASFSSVTLPIDKANSRLRISGQFILTSYVLRS